MQTILGSGGVIGNEIAKALRKYTDRIKLVSRNPEKVNPDDILFSADLKDPDQVRRAVSGSEVVYLTVGLPYDRKTWREQWPVIMRNVTDACVESGCKLVFFDNIYMYDKNYLDGMDENTPINPPSEKGKVRRDILEMLWTAVRDRGLKALVARSADFYGPGIRNTSMLSEMVIKPLFQGRRANWIGSPDYPHSFTYTIDAGRATALLGNTDEAYGETWHLPTDPTPFTGQEWVENIAREMGVKPRLLVANKFMIRLMGLFIPVMREMVEMLYQYDRTYVFDSSKIEKRFDLKPTPYTTGIKEVIQTDYSNRSKK